MVAPEVTDQSRRRVDHKAGTADDEGISAADGRDCAGQYLLIQPLFVEDDVRLDDTAAFGAARHTGAVGDEVHIVERAALDAVVAQGAAVELVHRLGACRLMEAVDVLGDDGFQLALPLELRQTQMRRVGLCSLDDELIAVEAVELLGALFPEGVTQDRLGRVIVFLMVEAVHTAEVRDAAFS